MSGKSDQNTSAPVAAATPMMAQFLSIKAGYPDALLFYRMGDFYEMFFDDAVAASAALDIALTKRGKHLGEDIPMCGVPVHSAEGYFLTLIRKGFRVAVCEQLEDPAEAKKRGAKSVVHRDVVRLVTPGTLTEDSLLDARRNNFLLAVAQLRDGLSLAWVDISTGELRSAPCPMVRLGPEIARLAPREVLMSEAVDDTIETILRDSGAAVTPMSRASFDSASAEKRLCELFKVDTMDGFGGFDRAEIAAMGALIDYLDITQKGKLPLVRPPVRETLGQVMQIDAATRRNLELTRSLNGGREGSLLSVIDRTVTAGGGRLLERRLSAPLCDLDVLRFRLDAVAHFVSNAGENADLRDHLRHLPDMDRALSRIGLDRAGPRDLAAIRDGLSHAEAVGGILAVDAPPLLQSAASDLSGHGALIDLLDAALVAEPPLLARDGGFIAPDFDTELDQSRELRDQGRGVIARMQADLIAETGINALKIKHNNVLGYFIEVTSTHADKLFAQPETFIHRQTNANVVRFSTVELGAMETKILNAGARALELEKAIFARLRAAILDKAPAIMAAAAGLSEIDLAAAFGDLARGENWCRPKLDDSRAFNIKAGRHPVVEHALRSAQTGRFVPNDCALSQSTSDDSGDIWLLTGPNMAGKSTFLRQNALIALLAQCGSYVPAASAHIGLVSQLFSRVGASDDLARGRSTFMVEMVETAAILHQADARALVILDEIGRGTATYDGLSIAWATLENLHGVNRCRALFATHYHELTQLADTLIGVENATVSVREHDGDVIFMHEVIKGRADRSYGVQVARLAGLPETVVERARVVLAALEDGDKTKGTNPKAIIDDLPLFSAIASTPKPSPKGPSPVDEKLAGVFPDELTPKQALALIYDLKALTQT